MLRNKPLQKRIVIVIVAVLLTVGLLISARKYGYYDYVLDRRDNLSYVKFVNMGQGECTVVRCNDKYMVIDTGQSADSGLTVESSLFACGVKDIECVVITNESDERAGGLPHILENFKVKNVVVPKDAFTDNSNLSVWVKEAMHRAGLDFIYAAEGDKVKIGDCTLEFIRFFEGDTVSENFLISMLDLKGKRFLFCSDVTVKQEEQMVDDGCDIRCNVYKASHHGGAGSNSEAFISAARPEYCIISCGDPEYYSYPSPKVVTRLRELDIPFFTTFENGDIIFNLNDYSIQTEK